MESTLIVHSPVQIGRRLRSAHKDEHALSGSEQGKVNWTYMCAGSSPNQQAGQPPNSPHTLRAGLRDT